MSKRFLVTFLILAASVFASAPARFIEANKAFEEGKFEVAVQLYEALLSEGQTSVELYFNLANACFKNNENGKAILNYERALALAPRDEDILFNLDLARVRITDKVEQVPMLFVFEWWDMARSQFSFQETKILTLVFFWLTVALFSLLAFRIRLNSLPFLLAFFGVLALLSSAMFVNRWYELNFRKEAIILSEQVEVMSAPTLTAVEKFTVHEGLKVQMKESTAGWANIQLPDGKEGWVRSTNLETI